MKGLVLACAAAAFTLTDVPAAAQHYTRQAACDQWRHGHCASWHSMTHRETKAPRYSVGYNFGPHYSYVGTGALPQGLVSRYHLGPGFRYVNADGRVYIVNPHTYRVVRVITLP